MKDVFKYLIGAGMAVIILGAASQPNTQGQFQIFAGKSGLTYTMEEESRIIKLDTQTGESWVYFESKEAPAFRWGRIITVGSQ